MKQVMAFLTEKRNRPILQMGLCIVLALVSFFFLADLSIWDKTNHEMVAYLDEKKETVLMLTGTVAATSTALTLIPGDVALPLAEQLAALTNYFMIVFAAIWLQKYLIGLTGVIVFKCLLPISLVLLAGNVFWKKAMIKQVVSKLLLFSLLVFTLIPSSIAVSRHIEVSHEASIQQTIKAAEKANKAIETKASDNDDLLSKVTTAVSTAFKGTTDKAKKVFGQMIDAVSVLLITTCVIPILVFALFIWLANSLLGLDIPYKPSLSSRLTKHKL